MPCLLSLVSRCGRPGRSFAPWEKVVVVEDTDVTSIFLNLAQCGLKARHEEELLAKLSTALLTHVGCSAVLVRLLERYIQTRAVATPAGVQLIPYNELVEPWTQAEQARWLSLADGLLVPDVASDPELAAEYREFLLHVGVKTLFAVPIIREGEVYGQLVFGWPEPPPLSQAQRRHLRRLADYAALTLTLFQVQKSREIDPLTGLLNQVGLRRRWEAVAATARGALMLADLDGFKTVNQRQGNLVGDRLLQRVGRLLREASGPQAQVARYRDDVFVILLPGADEAQVEEAANRLRRQLPAVLEALSCPPLAISVGAAYWPQEGRTLEPLLQQADQRMRQEKSRRRLAALAAPPAGGRQWGFPTVPQSLIHSWLEACPEGVLLLDAEGRVVYVNPAYERLSGYSLEALQGRRPPLVAIDLEPGEELWEYLQTRGTWVGEICQRHRSGAELISFFSIARLQDAEGQLAGYLGLVRDLSLLLGQDGSPGLVTALLQGGVAQQTLALALAQAAELYEPDIQIHLRRVRHLTRLLLRAAVAQGLPAGVPPERQPAVVQASVLHDVGKIAIPHSILLKPARLTAEEFNLVKNHTVVGHQLLRGRGGQASHDPVVANFLETAARIARHHHERWDGSGYPDGLAGEAIPWEARVVAIADVYDALRSRRPHKAAWSHQRALRYLEEQAGYAFDPALVEAFLRVSEEVKAVSARRG